MLIYRIESLDDSRKGPWNNDDNAAYYAHCVADRLGVISPYRHPTPGNDGIDIDWEDVCGLPSLDAYRTWFAHPKVRAELYKHNMHMRVYDVPDHLIKKGMLQVCFRIHDATSVRLATKEEMS